MVGELFRRGFGADAAPGEAAKRGWIWRCGVGRLNRQEIRDDPPHLLELGQKRAA